MFDYDTVGIFAFADYIAVSREVKTADIIPAVNLNAGQTFFAQLVLCNIGKSVLNGCEIELVCICADRSGRGQCEYDSGQGGDEYA